MTEIQILNKIEKLEEIDSENNSEENNYELFKKEINHLRIRLLFSLENDPVKMVEYFKKIRAANNPNYKKEDVS